MANQGRRTAILRVGEVGAREEVRALDVQRLYPFELTIDGRSAAAGNFASPLGDQTWRDYTGAMETAVAAPDTELEKLRRPQQTVGSAGRQLYATLVQLSPALRTFLTDTTPRRLVILSSRPELHALPWEAMVDEQWKHHACSGLSIVHATDVFDPVPEPIRPPLAVKTIIGPGTQRLTEPAIGDLIAKASRRRNPRVVRAADGDGASIVHIEAHGDLDAGTIDLGRADFLDRQRSACMVLLWSCVSNLIQPWGESLAMKLHRQENRLVLGFTAHVRQDTAGKLAQAFYEQVFDGQPPLDPETAIVQQRCQLFADRPRACEWASMAVWLRGALDLDAAVLDGPRLPEDAWESQPAGPASDFVQAQMRRYGAEGRIIVIPRTAVVTRADLDVASAFRGVAVHLRQAQCAEDLSRSLDRLRVRPTSVHAGDRLVTLVSALSQYPHSLLLWTGVGQNEIDAARWLGRVPSGLSIVLVSPIQPEIPPGIVVTDPGAADAAPPAADTDLLKTVESWTETGENSRVAETWNDVVAQAKTWDTDRQRRLNAAGYWAFARLDRWVEAEACLRVLDDVAPVEAALLRGNLASRRRKPEEASKWYRDAEKTGNDRDKGRALLELAYLASRRADRGETDVLYGEALSRLEAATDADDSLWRSALGRALRDYADVLASDPARLDEAAGYLERALVIHAIDGRSSQIAVALQTRGKLECCRNRFAAADEAVGAAVALQARFKNHRGWSKAMQQLIEVALEASATLRARALAETLFERLGQEDDDRGNVASLAARACWQLGDIAAAAKWANTALEQLPASRRDDHIRIAIIRNVAKSLDG